MDFVISRLSPHQRCPVCLLVLRLPQALLHLRVPQEFQVHRCRVRQALLVFLQHHLFLDLHHCHRSRAPRNWRPQVLFQELLITFHHHHLYQFLLVHLKQGFLGHQVFREVYLRLQDLLGLPRHL